MKSTRDGFFFFRSFYDAIQLVPNDESKLKLYEALCQYAIMGKEPQIDGWDLALFMTWKVNVDNSNSRREASIQNGSKGGRPAKPKKTQIEPEENQEKINKFLEKNNFQLGKPLENLNNNINNDVSINGYEQLGFKEEVPCENIKELTVEDKIQVIDHQFNFEKRFFLLTNEKTQMTFEEKMKELLLQYNDIYKIINLKKLDNTEFINLKFYEKLIKNHSEPRIIFYALVQSYQLLLPSNDPRIRYTID